MAKSNELGFGSSFYSSKRYINKDGSFNVVREGLPFFRPYDLYHSLISMGWWKFNLLVIALYLVANLVFGCIYYFIGVNQLDGIQGTSEFDKFIECFFFSGQTITTLGYGRISPVGLQASIATSIESLLGLLFFALATGLLYGRFSRPQARIIYSKQALIAPYKTGKAFMFRLANQRKNELIEVEAQVILAYTDTETNKRVFERLALERDRINFLALSWTIVHPIIKSSPLSMLTLDNLKDYNAEFIIMLKAFDESFSQTVYSRTSYQIENLVNNAKFNSIIDFTSKNAIHIQLNSIDKFQQL